jgi:hypothetical protein
VLDAHFAITADQFRAEDKEVTARAGRDERLRRYTYNPLRGRPLLTGFGPGYLCPVPYLALAKATPWGVYFTGLSKYGDSFARDLGHLFEQYIGRQLRLLPGAGPRARWPRSGGTAVQRRTWRRCPAGSASPPPSRPVPGN